MTQYYYADQPAGQVAGTPGAAKASLHKARRRLREYITAHRPDLIPAATRRTPDDRCPHRARRPLARTHTRREAWISATCS